MGRTCIRSPTKGAPCTQAKPCKTIAGALAKAKKGAKVLVARGTYREEVKIAADVQLIGQGKPVIDATGLGNGVLITGTAAAGPTVRGFIIRNANFEGILASGTTKVTIRENTVSKNDRGGSAVKPVSECAPEGVVPGDCGEALHLMSVTHSTALDNTVSDNAGGILVTDELGPTAFNTIKGNKVLDNVLDCGITLAGHNPKAVVLSTTPGPPTMAALAPTVGGIYSNVITKNTVTGNGTQGQGGGILMAGGPPGTAVYNNTVSYNTASGNGLGGVTLHSHAPGQDRNGNVISHNTISDDGIHGYPTGAPGDSDAGITRSVGIVVWSAATPLTGTSIVANKISHDYYGIWTKNVPTIAQSANTFASTVTVPLFQG
ncbi:MAG: right-handed parallel beta-helix repeat-containing protein [Solirubrobacteraceae bacterium]